jgi:hypothetical protein
VRAEVVFLSVALDRNLQVRIGKVHSGNEGALIVEDLVLPFRGRKEMGIQEVQQPSFERAPRHRQLELALLQDLGHQCGSGSALPPQTLEGFPNRSLGYQSTTTSFVDSEIETPAIQDPREVDYRAGWVGDPHAIEPAQIVAWEIHDSSNLDVLVWRSQVTRRGYLYWPGRPVHQGLQRCRRSMGQNPAIANPHVRSSDEKKPRGWGSRQAVNAGEYRDQQAGLAAPSDCLSVEPKVR